MARNSSIVERLSSSRVKDTSTSTVKKDIDAAATVKIVSSKISYIARYYNVDIQYPETIFDTIIKEFDGDLIDTIEADRQFNYRPENVSHVVYGSVDLWFIIMLLNNISCHEEFVFKEGHPIKILSGEGLSVIEKLIRGNSESIQESRFNPPNISDLTIREIFI